MEDVLSLLPADPTRLRWQDLLAKAKTIGMSSATLSKHLKKFVELGLVRREVDATSYPPAVTYRRAPHPVQPDTSFPVDKMDSVWLTTHTIPLLTRMLIMQSNRTEAQARLERILRYSLSRFTSYLAWVLREVLSESSQQDADERVRIVIETYITSWILRLAELCYENRDISSHALALNAKAVLDLTDDKLDDFMKYPEMKKIMKEE
jgi:DNA-binding transcriptional ArsR family regulator